MKRILSGVMATAAVLALAALACAQGNNRGKSEVTLGKKTVSVDFGRPALKGRKVEAMLSQLGAGEVWRLGMNQSTTLTTTGDLTFGDVKVPAGTYSLWARKEADNSWKLVFNKQHGQWGTDHDAAQDLAAVPLTQTKTNDSAEQVTINLAKAGDDGSITVLWGDMKLATDFQ